MQAEAIDQGPKTLHELISSEIASNTLELPVFNQVALKLQETLGDEDATIEDIESLIMEDPSLAGQILKVANSAFYKGLGEINTIKHAILRLGSEQVATLAMVATQKQTYLSHDPVIKEYMDKLWVHSFASAVGCRWLAQNSGYASDANVAFLAGLLHDIGKLVIIKILEKLRSENRIPGTVTTEAIFEILESTMHTTCGFELVTAWNLPEPFGSVVLNHHNPEPDESQELLGMLRLVNMVCDRMGLSLRENQDVLPSASLEAQKLGLNEMQLAELEILLEDTLEMDVDF